MRAKSFVGSQQQLLRIKNYLRAKNVCEQKQIYEEKKWEEKTVVGEIAFPLKPSHSES
jgi:hypothetical protein